LAKSKNKNRNFRIAITGSHSVGKTTLARQLVTALNKEEKVRIAVTGAHGTGKTTLAKHLAGRNKWRMLPDVCSEAVKLGVPLNEGTSLMSQVWLFGKQYEQEQFGSTPWVADKCMVDMLAYATHLFDHNAAAITVFRQLAAQRFSSYDVVFYLPIEFPIEDDGFRSTDPEFQRSIDNLVLGILKERGIRFVELRGTRVRRFHEAMKIIKALK
jgi:nicotinamide riboside kinase